MLKNGAQEPAIEWLFVYHQFKFIVLKQNHAYFCI